MLNESLIIVNMSYTVENKDELISFIKNTKFQQSVMMDLKLSYQLNKKNNILDFLPIYKDLQNIALDYDIKKEVIKCNYYSLIGNNWSAEKYVKIIFPDAVFEFSSHTNSMCCYKNSDKYENRIDNIKTIINDTFDKLTSNDY